MKERSAGYGYTQGQPRRVLGGLDTTALPVPLGPAGIADIARRRKRAQLELRQRIDEGVVSDG